MISIQWITNFLCSLFKNVSTAGSIEWNGITFKSGTSSPVDSDFFVDLRFFYDLYDDSSWIIWCVHLLMDWNDSMVIVCRQRVCRWFAIDWQMADWAVFGLLNSCKALLWAMQRFYKNPKPCSLLWMECICFFCCFTSLKIVAWYSLLNRKKVTTKKTSAFHPNKIIRNIVQENVLKDTSKKSSRQWCETFVTKVILMLSF